MSRIRRRPGGKRTAQKAVERSVQVGGVVAAADKDHAVILRLFPPFGQDLGRLHHLADGLQQETPGRCADHALYPHQIIAACVQERRKPQGK